MSAQHDDAHYSDNHAPDRPGVPAIPVEPLSALETHLANAEAIERAPLTSEAVSEARRHGRIEAETRRISDEMTRRARVRRRAPQAQQTDQAVPPAALAGPAIREELRAAAPPVATAVPLRPIPTSTHFERILVPLDGTFYAERALPYATALARLTGASVVLGHVGSPPLPAPARAVRGAAAELVGSEHEPRAADMAAYLDAQRVLQAFHAPAVRVETSEDTDPVFGLRQMAARAHADVIVVATHARRGIERHVLGGTANALVEQSHIPLLVVPPKVVVPPDPPSFARILVPLDGSETAEHALGLLAGLLQSAASADPSGANHVRPEVTLLTVAESRSRLGGARTYLDAVAARLKATVPGKLVRIAKRVRLGSAPGAIVAMAAQGMHSPEIDNARSDLVVMATHGRGGLGRLLYGSVARYVLPRVTVPVLLVHPADAS